MYLNPPCETFTEFQARLDAGEVFRVYKRRVNLRTNDKSCIRVGKSTIMLQHNGEKVAVRVVIFKYQVQSARLAPIFFIENSNDLKLTEEIKAKAEVVEEELSFAEMQKRVNERVAEFLAKNVQKQEENPNEGSS